MVTGFALLASVSVCPVRAMSCAKKFACLRVRAIVDSMCSSSCLQPRRLKYPTQKSDRCETASVVLSVGKSCRSILSKMRGMFGLFLNSVFVLLSSYVPYKFSPLQAGNIMFAHQTTRRSSRIHPVTKNFATIRDDFASAMLIRPVAIPQRL